MDLSFATDKHRWTQIHRYFLAQLRITQKYLCQSVEIRVHLWQKPEATNKGRQPMARMVNCVKLGRELPGLEKPPYPGELGQRIYDNVSQDGWDAWMAHSVILINHYGLSFADPRAVDFMKEQMEEFFFGEDAQMPEGWTPEGQTVKGAPQK